MAAGRGLHASSILAATDDNMTEFCSDVLIFTGQEGHSAVEVLMQITDVTNCAFNFGFNDDVAEGSNTLPVELSGTTWTSNAATFIGLVYDTDATNDNIHCFWVDDDTDTTTAIADLRLTGAAPTNSQWFWMRVEIQDRGSGNGLRATLLFTDHNGRSYQKEFNTTVDRDQGLCYYLGVENRSDSSRSVYIKAPAWEQGIT